MAVSTTFNMSSVSKLGDGSTQHADGVLGVLWSGRADADFGHERGWLGHLAHEVGGTAIGDVLTGGVCGDLGK